MTVIAAPREILGALLGGLLDTVGEGKSNQDLPSQ
jgi:hypothetical protein